ncbi:MAG: helix-turn-helix transcriptional regulator [Deltaproteobacteria bacterium]|nr:helix-turn-helix transcriptional regulator [Deltaproteobacteria bacterium]
MTKSIFSGRYDLFRARLIEAREKADLTQADVAARLGKFQSFVSKYELGERRLDVVEFLDVATALGVEPCKILMELQKVK